jgi:hypothetical protein
VDKLSEISEGSQSFRDHRFLRWELFVRSDGVKWLWWLIIIAAALLAAAWGFSVGLHDVFCGDRADSIVVLTSIGRAGGRLVTVSAAGLLLSGCQQFWTWMRLLDGSRIFPIDDMMPYFHKVLAIICGIGAAVHTVFVGAIYIIRFVRGVPGMDLKMCVFAPGVCYLQELITGILLATAFFTMLALPFFRVRDGIWQIFWKHHLVMIWFIYVLLIVHGCHKGDLFTIYSVGPVMLVYIVDVVVRIRHKAMKNPNRNCTVTDCGNNVMEVSLEKPWPYKPGMYARICIPALGEHEYHPFTIASAPHEPNGRMSFYVKVLGDWTQKLQDLVSDAGGTISTPIKIAGPFGSPSMHWDQFDHILIVAGGIGATPINSIVRDIILHRRGSDDMDTKSMPSDIECGDVHEISSNGCNAGGADSGYSQSPLDFARLFDIHLMKSFSASRTSCSKLFYALLILEWSTLGIVLQIIWNFSVYLVSHVETFVYDYVDYDSRRSQYVAVIIVSLRLLHATWHQFSYIASAIDIACNSELRRRSKLIAVLAWMMIVEGAVIACMAFELFALNNLDHFSTSGPVCNSPTRSQRFVCGGTGGPNDPLTGECSFGSHEVFGYDFTNLGTRGILLIRLPYLLMLMQLVVRLAFVLHSSRSYARPVRKDPIQPKSLSVVWSGQSIAGFEWFRASLEELGNLMATQFKGFVQLHTTREAPAESTAGHVQLLAGRPHWKDVVARAVAHASATSACKGNPMLGVFFCGPATIGQDLAKACAEHMESELDMATGGEKTTIAFFEETF